MTKEEEKIRDSNNKISCITKSECFTVSDIPASFVLITGGNIATVTPPDTQDMITNGVVPVLTSTPTFTYSTIPSNIANVTEYFPDYDIKELYFSHKQVFLMKNNLFGFNQSHEILLTGAIPSP